MPNSALPVSRSGGFTATLAQLQRKRSDRRRKKFFAKESGQFMAIIVLIKMLSEIVLSDRIYKFYSIPFFSFACVASVSNVSEFWSAVKVPIVIEKCNFSCAFQDGLSLFCTEFKCCSMICKELFQGKDGLPTLLKVFFVPFEN